MKIINRDEVIRELAEQMCEEVPKYVVADLQSSIDLLDGCPDEELADLIEFWGSKEVLIDGGHIKPPSPFGSPIQADLITLMDIFVDRHCRRPCIAAKSDEVLMDVGVERLEGPIVVFCYDDEGEMLRAKRWLHDNSIVHKGYR